MMAIILSMSSIFGSLLLQLQYYKISCLEKSDEKITFLVQSYLRCGIEDSYATGGGKFGVGERICFPCGVEAWQTRGIMKYPILFTAVVGLSLVSCGSKVDEAKEKAKAEAAEAQKSAEKAADKLKEAATEIKSAAGDAAAVAADKAKEAAAAAGVVAEEAATAAGQKIEDAGKKLKEKLGNEAAGEGSGPAEEEGETPGQP